MGRFELYENYSRSSSYTTPSIYVGPSDNVGPFSNVGQSNYACPSSNARTSTYNEEDDDPEGNSFLNNERSDSEPDEVEEEDQFPANHENDDEVSIDIMMDVLGTNADVPTTPVHDYFDLNMPAVSVPPYNLYPQGTLESKCTRFFDPSCKTRIQSGRKQSKIVEDHKEFRYCRNVISIDGTHLYTRYKHKLLVAVTLDANNQVLPLVFALVDEETLASWTWFLQMLAKHFLPGEDDRVCLISDRHGGLTNAVNYVPTFKFPHGVHRFCLRHVCSNFNNKYKNIQLKDLCWRAGAESSARKFDQIIEKIKGLNEEAYDWLGNIDKTQWTLAHDGGWRTGILMTNISEAVNGVLKVTDAYRCANYGNNIKSISTIFLAAYNTC
ncbi:UNVERIFIED_CONTAM: hypothetical protein Sradi_2089400 [Sesamum radiatum]|uniref:MULE transposase domain-containing protein n=1 Tax=Sesamum radiatum TaxID=300843 RepID=A0AAW2TLH0_SESRA